MTTDSKTDGHGAMFVTADEASPLAAFIALPDPIKDGTRIRQAVRAHYPNDQWYKVAPPLRDRLRERQRQALVAYLVSGADQRFGLRWKDTNALYAESLIDVEMDPCMITSRIKQALSSVQTFTQRCLLNLEDLTVYKIAYSAVDGKTQIACK